MNVEAALISKVVYDGGFEQVLAAGISVEHFETDREQWDFLLRHYHKHSKAPGIDAFRANYPKGTYKLPETDEPLQYYIDELHAARRWRLTVLMLQDAAATVGDDPGKLDEAVRIVNIGMSEINRIGTTSIDHVYNAESRERIRTYQEWARDPDALRGLDMGFASINHSVRGLQPSMLIGVIGPPGVGKTTLGLNISTKLHDDGAKVMVVSFEMPYDEIAARLDGIRGGVSHHSILRGKLGPATMARLRAAMKEDEDREQLIIVEDIGSTITISGLQAKIEQHRPDAVLVDGVYMMHDEEGERPGSESALRNLSRGLRRMTLATTVPIIYTTQVLEGKMRAGRVALGSIGYTSAFAQDATAVISIERDTSNDYDPGAMIMRGLKVRNGPLFEVGLYVDYRTSSITEDALPDEDDDDDEQRRSIA